ncbi:MAG: polyprenyl synthetase family protein [Solirubrobacteraceae bacterium]|nr:polyprenyl synthetase family protein [Solirubrobacteraceae bacterium]
MTAPNPAAQVASLVDAAGPRVPELLARVEDVLHDAAIGHGPTIGEPADGTIAAGGKRLRPLLVLLAAGVGTDEPDAERDRDLVRAAAAVELVHTATLAHDDVLDASPLRRGHPTVWATHGREMATAVGDLLFSRAFAELTETGSLESVRALSRASSALAEGELLQRSDAWNAEVPLERYLQRCELKTATLFQSACELGALHGGGDVEALGAFGRRIGLAFQLLDDVLDVAGPPERTGKPVGTDLLDGTVTLPLILARERDAALAAEDLRAITTTDAAAEICARIAATGALDAAREQALTMVAEAKAGLPDVAQRRVLELVADSVVDRYS